MSMSKASKTMPIEVDTNFNVLGPDKPTLIQQQVDHFGISHGDRILVYQDDDEWEGQAIFDESLPGDRKWYVDLGSEKFVSKDRFLGRKEGYANGFVMGQLGLKLQVAKEMKIAGIDDDLIHNFTQLSINRIRNL